MTPRAEPGFCLKVSGRYYLRVTCEPQAFPRAACFEPNPVCQHSYHFPPKQGNNSCWSGLMYDRQNRFHASSNFYPQHAFTLAFQQFFSAGWHRQIIPVRIVVTLASWLRLKLGRCFRSSLDHVLPVLQPLSKAVMGLYVGRYYELLAWVLFDICYKFRVKFLFIPCADSSAALKFVKKLRFKCKWSDRCGNWETLCRGEVLVLFGTIVAPKSSNSLSCRTSGTYGFQRTCTHPHVPPIHYRTSSSMASSRRPEPKIIAACNIMDIIGDAEKNPEKHEILWTCNCLNSVYEYPYNFMIFYVHISK